MIPRALPFLLFILAACPGAVREEFALSTDGPSRPPMLPLEDGALIANAGGRLVRLAPAGRTVWRVDLQRAILARPAVANGIVVAATSGGEWVGVSLADGTERWRQPEGPPQRVDLASSGERIFAAAPDGSVRAILAEDGATVWTTPLGRESSTSRRPPAVCGESLIVPRDDTTLVALALSDGAERWRRTTGTLAGMRCLDGQVLVSLTDGHLVALESDSGTERWRRRLAEALIGPAVASGANLWVQSGPRQLAGVDRKGSGSLLTLDTPVVMGAEPTAGDGWLALVDGEREGFVVGLEVPGGGVLFRRRVDSPLRVPALVQGDAVWVLPRDGRVIGLRVRLPR